MKIWQLQELLATKDPSDDINFKIVNQGMFGIETRVDMEFSSLVTSSVPRYRGENKPEGASPRNIDSLTMVFRAKKEG